MLTKNVHAESLHRNLLSKKFTASDDRLGTNTAIEHHEISYFNVCVLNVPAEMRSTSLDKDINFLLKKKEERWRMRIILKATLNQKTNCFKTFAENAKVS
jgi:hypothetical protein